MKLVFVLVTVFLWSFMIASTSGQTPPPRAKPVTTRSTVCPFVQPASFVNNKDDDGFSISKSSESIESIDDGYTISKNSKSVESIENGYSISKSSESIESIEDGYSTNKSSESTENIQSRAPGDCDDGVPCTIDCFGKNGCVNEPKDILCDDGFDCTIDKCLRPNTNPNSIPNPNVKYECEHTARIAPSMCEDSNACTTDTCTLKSGCLYTLKDCNDNNLCTTDICNQTSAVCSNVPVACDNGGPCTTGSCDPATGYCSYTTAPGCVPAP